MTKMTVQMDKTMQITLTMSESELNDLMKCISELVLEKIDLKKYGPIFAIKDAITLRESRIKL